MFPENFEATGCPPFARMHGHGRHGQGHEHHWEAHEDFAQGPGFGPRQWGGHRPPFARGPRHFGPPWRHGGWQPDPQREEARARIHSLRASIFSLIALVRAAEPQQLDAVQGVLNDARKRIAAILAERTPETPSPLSHSDPTLF